MDVRSQLRKVVLGVLDDPEIQYSDALSTANCAIWDSVAMVQIILGVEEEFGLRFTTDEMAEVRSVADIVGLLEKYGRDDQPPAQPAGAPPLGRASHYPPKTDRQVIVVGGGGHAKVVISSLRAQGYKICTVYDDDSAKWGQRLLGLPIAGPIERLGEPDRHPAVIALGDPLLRKQLAERYARDWITVIHPRAYVDDSVTIGPGSVVFAGAVIQPGTTIGSHCIINTSASVDHDCVLSDYINIAPGAHLASKVRVASGADLGTGANVIPGISIGEFSVVGSGATVIHDVPPYVTAVGCPARVIKRRAPAE